MVLHTLFGFGNSSTLLANLTKHNAFYFSINSVGPLNPESCNTTTLLRTLEAGNTGSAKRTARKLRAAKTVREGLREFGPRNLGPRGLFCNSYTVLKHHTNVTTVTHFWWRLIQCANCRTDLQTPICNENQMTPEQSDPQQRKRD